MLTYYDYIGMGVLFFFVVIGIHYFSYLVTLWLMGGSEEERDEKIRIKDKIGQFQYTCNFLNKKGKCELSYEEIKCVFEDCIFMKMLEDKKKKK